MIKFLLKKIAEWRYNRHWTVRCDVCFENYHTRKQAGICPHEPIKQFIYGRYWDNARSDQNSSVEATFEREENGNLKIVKIRTLGKEKE